MMSPAAHLASFDDIEAIAREKSMICSGLVENGLLIFPSDTTFSEIIIGIADKRKVRYVTFGSYYSDNILLESIMFKNNKTYRTRFVLSQICFILLNPVTL